MIGTLLHVQWLQMSRDRVALASIFLLPILFFSVTALIFGNMDEDSGKPLAPIKIAVTDGDNSEVSRSLLSGLAAVDAVKLDIEVVTKQTVSSISKRVRAGEFSLAVVVPKGFGEAFPRLDLSPPAIELIFDGASPIDRHLVSGALQAAALTLIPYLNLSPEHLENLSPERRKLLAAIVSQLRWPSAASAPTVDSSPADLIAIRTSDARGTRNGASSYYAAGTGVMFLLFSMARAGGSLVEEREEGTLDRILNANTSSDSLLLAKWLFYFLLGVVQVSSMFVWAALVFDVPLWSAPRLVGCLAMNIVTAAAASGFGVILATMFTTRAQLYGISTIIILIMSALGGSMAPRFLMPPFMDTVALFTFNGWALDGYLKVFWYDDGSTRVSATLIALWPELLMLSAMTIVFLVIARRLVSRWVTA